MDASIFDYDLPAERIAQEPAKVRDASKLLVVNRQQGSLEHRSFRDLPDYLGEKDLLFRNTAKVLPARIYAARPTGGQVECLLLRPANAASNRWWCLLRPGRKLPPGSKFGLEEQFEAKVMNKNDEAHEYLVHFKLFKHASVAALAADQGKMPLPPYIRRDKHDDRDSDDKSRYQTVFASDNKMVAAAAPTAGLHFTPELNQKLKSQGVETFDLTLHVGMGTFKPLEEGEIAGHEIHRELYEIPVEAQAALRSAPTDGRRRVCVGTTSTRSIEDYLTHAKAATNDTWLREADIFIYPPYRFLGVDALITNFHMPKSTLLCLVSSFLSQGDTDGIDWLKEIYAEAIAREYRFLSYGDAMLIL
ncbi:MAG: tRNA preQ1(34) S-adenosylmethionine ribosyltransferase-isomerase QueA [Verrucomicrobiota bacterium]